MVTIRHKQTGETLEVNVDVWDLETEHSQDNWDIVSEKNIAQLYIHKNNDWEKIGRVELEHAKVRVGKFPNDYKFDQN